MDRKLAAILAADVVGYSAQMERDEAGTFDRLKAGRTELFEPEIARHHGRIFKLMGDGLLAEFASVVDAVECAVALQRGLSERNAALAEDQQILVRIGINLGEVIVDGDDRYGEGVNIAARLQQLAEAGGICVSGKVAKEVEKKLAFGFEPMGEKKVKNVSEPVQVFRIALDKQGISPRSTPQPFSRLALPGVAVAAALLTVGGAAWHFWPTASVGTKPSVAVLPFDNYGGDEASGRLSDGLTEDIITDLARFPELEVVARNSTEVYKGKPVDAREVAKALQVSYVVEGSIQRYRGEHEAIVPTDLWDKVHSILKESPRKRAGQSRRQTPALLKGLIFGPTGCAMSPTHTRKAGRLYRYYVSQAVLKQGAGTCPVGRLPASEIEQAVVDQVRRLIQSVEMVAATASEVASLDGRIGEEAVRKAIVDFELLWDELFPSEQARIVQLLVERVDVRQDGISLRLRPGGLARLTEEMGVQLEHAA